MDPSTGFAIGVYTIEVVGFVAFAVAAQLENPNWARNCWRETKLAFSQS